MLSDELRLTTCPLCVWDWSGALWEAGAHIKEAYGMVHHSDTSAIGLERLRRVGEDVDRGLTSKERTFTI